MLENGFFVFIHSNGNNSTTCRHIKDDPLTGSTRHWTIYRGKNNSRHILVLINQENEQLVSKRALISTSCHLENKSGASSGQFRLEMS